MTPVLGSLDNDEMLIREARASDGVVKAADSNHRSSLEALASFAQISASASQSPLPRVLGLHFRAGAVLLPPSARFSTVLNNFREGDADLG